MWNYYSVVHTNLPSTIAQVFQCKVVLWNTNCIFRFQKRCEWSWKLLPKEELVVCRTSFFQVIRNGSFPRVLFNAEVCFCKDYKRNLMLKNLAAFSIMQSSVPSSQRHLFSESWFSETDVCMFESESASFMRTEQELEGKKQQAENAVVHPDELKLCLRGKLHVLQRSWPERVELLFLILCVICVKELMCKA